MTTTIMRNTVSVDLVITTPEQIRDAFLIWGVRADDTDAFEVSAEMTKQFLEILKELNNQ